MMKIILLLLIYISLFGKDIVLNSTEKEYLKNHKTITMCVDPDWKPFEIINQAREHEGIAADLIKIVSKKLDIDIELVHSSTWDESVELSKQKKCDILSFLNDSPERSKWLIFTKPLLIDPNVLITTEEHPDIDDIEKLHLQKVALPSNTYVLERMKKEYPDLVYIPTSSEEESMSMVSKKHADITVRSLVVAGYVIKKQGWFNLKNSRLSKRL